MRLLPIISFILLLFGCSTTPSTPENNDSGSTTSTTETTQLKTSSIEAFWKTFQVAVKDRDIEKINSLFTPEASTMKFGDEYYQTKIAEGKYTDIIETGEEYQGKDVYAFEITFPMEDSQAEASNTTIYLIQNDEGNFRIFNVLEAG